MAATISSFEFTRGKSFRSVVKGIERQEAAGTHVERLEQAEKTCKGKLYMLIYDIPTSKNEDCPNPSEMLWSYGFRLNLSCWVLPERGLKRAAVQELLRHYAQHHIETHIIPYADEALEQIRSICRAKLSEEITRLHTSLIQRIISAKERYTELERAEETTGPELDRAKRARNAAIKGIIKKSGEALNAAVSCAEMFEETESVQTLLDGLRKAIESERLSLKGAGNYNGNV